MSLNLIELPKIKKQYRIKVGRGIDGCVEGHYLECGGGVSGFVIHAVLRRGKQAVRIGDGGGSGGGGSGGGGISFLQLFGL